MTSDANTRSEPKSTLQNMDVHSGWIRNFRTRENDRFFNLAFDYVASVLGDPRGHEVLDAGCGSGTKSLYLARRGFRVHALDFSPAILEQARSAVTEAAMGEMIRFDVGDLTQLPLADRSVHRALCWGVAMHVPDIERTVAELSRVIAPGGILIMSEGNFRSMQATALRWLKALLGRERAEIHRTAAGIEHWEVTGTGRLMTRRADIPWLLNAFERHGLQRVARRAGQFTEIYTVVPWKPLRLAIHAFNNCWFRWVRWGGPSFGNIIVLRRPPA